MKHIYKLSIILVSVFTFIGCNVDDDDPISVLPQKDLIASFNEQVDIIRIADDATSYDLVIDFSENLPSYSTIEYALDGGSLSSTSANTGDNSITIPIDFGEYDNFHDIELTDFIVVNSSARRFTPSIGGNTTVRIMRQGAFSAPTGPVEITVTWANTARDLDIFLVTGNQDFAGALIDDSQGLTTTEIVTLPSDQTGEVFSIYMYEWDAFYPVDYNISFSFPGDQVQAFAGTITADSFQYVMLKESDGDQYIYRIIQL